MSYKDKDWLEDQYINQKKSSAKIAKEIEFSKSTILNWLKKFNIPRRSISESLKKYEKVKIGSYWGILNSNHSRTVNGYVLEHILIVEKMLGRSLKYYGKNHKDNEIVHHIDCDGFNNDIDNLYICSLSNHRNIHNKFGLMNKELFKRCIIYFDRNKGEYFLNKNIVVCEKS